MRTDPKHVDFWYYVEWCCELQNDILKHSKSGFGCFKPN